MCKVLFIEDELWFSELATKRIKQSVAEINSSPDGAFPELDFTLVTSLPEAEAHLMGGTYDAILLDLTLGKEPDCTTPLRTLQTARLNAKNWPAFIIVTGDTTGKYEQLALSCGAQEFWVKDDFLKWPPRAARSIVRSIERKKAAMEIYGAKN